MSDLSTVKAEIKAWERTFKHDHGREPTVDDIRLHPAIADCYKLYKKLSKAARTSAASSATLLPSSSHSAQTTAPLTTFNPFSPRKNRKKESSSQSLHLQASKSGAIPLILSNLSQTPPAPSSALSRARKRLRGDPVSPTPCKGKRPRLCSRRPSLDSGNSSSSNDERDMLVPPLFLSKSPVKPPHGSKSFKLLFQDSSKSAADEEAAPTTSLTKSKSARNLFGVNPRSISSGFDDVTSDIISVMGNSTIKTLPSSLLKADPTNDLAKDRSIPAIDKSKIKMPAKRSLSLSDPEPTNHISVAGEPLLPPSPPPPDTSTRAVGKFLSAGGQPKMKATARKKAKISDTEIDPDSNDEEDIKTTVKIVIRPHRILRNAMLSQQAIEEDDLDLDVDHLAHAGPRARGGVSSLPPGAQFEDEEGKKLEVDLPEQLRHVLALELTEAKARTSDMRKERLVKGLVSGTRVTHYDPTKGGEIWDVGEDVAEHEAGEDVDQEDEWEAEPVPWDVGEL